MPPTVTPDVNVLIAASRSDHPHHKTAYMWLDEVVAITGVGMPSIGSEWPLLRQLCVEKKLAANARWEASGMMTFALGFCRALTNCGRARYRHARTAEPGNSQRRLVRERWRHLAHRQGKCRQGADPLLFRPCASYV